MIDRIVCEEVHVLCDRLLHSIDRPVLLFHIFEIGHRMLVGSCANISNAPLYLGVETLHLSILCS